MQFDFHLPPETPADLDQFAALSRKNLNHNWCPNCYHWAVVYRIATDTVECENCKDRNSAFQRV